MKIAAECIIEAAAHARMVSEGFEDRRFLRDVYAACVALGTDGGLSWEAFGELVVRLHRASLLRITRCDLVSAFGADRVEASEVSYLGATFHFLAL